MFNFNFSSCFNSILYFLRGYRGLSTSRKEIFCDEYQMCEALLSLNVRKSNCTNYFWVVQIINLTVICGTNSQINWETQSHQLQTCITIDNTSKAIEKHIYNTFIPLWMVTLRVIVVCYPTVNEDSDFMQCRRWHLCALSRL